MRDGRVGVTPRCFRCGKAATEFSSVKIRWNTYKGSGSCFAALCNDCVNAVEPYVKSLTKEMTKDLNKEDI